jgi:ribosomal protein S16
MAGVVLWHSSKHSNKQLSQGAVHGTAGVVLWHSSKHSNKQLSLGAILTVAVQSLNNKLSNKRSQEVKFPNSKLNNKRLSQGAILSEAVQSLSNRHSSKQLRQTVLHTPIRRSKRRRGPNQKGLKRKLLLRKQ